MGIPIWVIFLFLVVIYIGIKRCFTRRIKVKRLIILPALFFILSIHKLTLIFQTMPLTILAWTIGVLIGIGFGCLHVKNKIIYVDKENMLVEIPGDWTMLLLIISIFAIEFIIHYAEAVSPLLAQTMWFYLSTIFISGLIIGTVFGRNGSYFYKFLKVKNQFQYEN